MITLIYAIRDNHWIKYVGKTCKALEWRLADHLTGARKGDQSYRGRGLRKMLREGRFPTISLIQVANGYGDKEEKAWIAYFRSYGIKLWNMTDGGDGVADSTGKIGKKISKTLTQMYVDHPEVKAKLASYRLGSHHSEKTITGMKIARNTPAARKRNSEAQKIANTKRYLDPKEHEKTSMAMRKLYEDPNERKKLSDAHIKRYLDPKEREKTSLATSKRYQDPKERLKMSIAGAKGWIKRKLNNMGGAV
ncbi:MAG: hypothetical protein WC455_19390 [Dehalococcoidia bacterium]|jgi:hypothetical protein